MKASKVSGSMGYIKDLPYPVGRETKTSFPDMKVRTASNCFSYDAIVMISPSCKLNGIGHVFVNDFVTIHSIGNNMGKILRFFKKVHIGCILIYYTVKLTYP